MRILIKHILGLIFLGGFLFLISSCQKTEENPYDTLIYENFTPLSIPEASGLATYTDNQYLSVSDSTSQVYVLNLKGIVVKKLSYVGKNLEGVVYVPNNSSIYVIEEKSNEVVQLDTNGTEITRFVVPLDNKDPKHGLEGITYNPTNSHLYVVSEKEPGLLFEMNLVGDVLKVSDLNFADDYSSVFYDPVIDHLWILSDDSKTLTKTNLQGSQIKTYNTTITKGEGVVVDSELAKCYIITDREGAVYTMLF